jgi:hypothetical protein
MIDDLRLHIATTGYLTGDWNAYQQCGPFAAATEDDHGG